MKLSFYDVKTKKKFTTDRYSIKKRSGRAFAVAKSPNGPHECWRVLSAKQAKELR